MTTCSRWFMVLVLMLGWGVSGCAMFGSGNDVQRFAVEASQLNRLEVYYTPAMGQATTHLTLMGSGHLRIQHGTSPLIGNDFSQDVKDTHWTDLSVDQLTVEPAEMCRVFQAFVDRGLVREKPAPDFLGSAERGGPFARVLGTLNNTVIARDVLEPELLSLIRELIKSFEQSAP